MLFQKTFLRILGTPGNLPTGLLPPSATQVPLLGSDVAPTNQYGQTNSRPALTPVAWPYSQALVGPSGQAATATSAVANLFDNVLLTSMKNKDSEPIRRLAISLTGPSGCQPQPASVFVWEETAGQWYQVNVNPTTGGGQSLVLMPGGIVYVDLPVLAEPTQAGGAYGWSATNVGALAPGSAGDMLIMLVPGNGNGQPNNSVFQFGMAPSVATSRSQAS